jgi:hypothetical protein
VKLLESSGQVQVSGDVYMHTEHKDREVMKGIDLVVKTVFFTVNDANRKSLEARKVCQSSPVLDSCLEMVSGQDKCLILEQLGYSCCSSGSLVPLC